MLDAGYQMPPTPWPHRAGGGSSIQHLLSRDLPHRRIEGANRFFDGFIVVCQ
jgi:hypothetical protein